MIAQYLFHPECEFLSAALPVPSETIFKYKKENKQKSLFCHDCNHIS